MQIRPEGAGFFHAERRTDGRTDRQTDRHEDTNTPFRNFSNAPKNVTLLRLKLIYVVHKYSVPTAQRTQFASVRQANRKMLKW
jgi:hypothetical protein